MILKAVLPEEIPAAALVLATVLREKEEDFPIENHRAAIKTGVISA